MKQIPLLDLSTEVDALWNEVIGAVERVLRTTQFIMGDEVKQFERELAAFFSLPHAVGLNSGTDALLIGLRALGIRPGDEVITTPFSFFATSEAISLAGAVPVFVDIDERTFNIDSALIEAAVTPRTRAIIPVHLFGQGADMSAIMEIAERHSLKVLEDNAQSFGGKWAGRILGTIGQIGALSFFPSKNLGAYGDAGGLITIDDELAATSAMLRSHGSKQKYHNEAFGYNSRLDSLQAAILRVKLVHVLEWNEARRAVATRYDELLADIPDIVTPYVAPKAYHVYHQYTLRVLGNRRDELQRTLKEIGIDTMIYYPVPLHKLPVYANQKYPELPRAERAATEVLSIPIGPHLSPETQEIVVDALRRSLVGGAIRKSC